MPDYDSDTSSEGGDDYTTTNVVLGYASNESSGDEISRIGGHPVWIDSEVKAPASFAKCKVCNEYMSLLLQLNADLQQYFPNDQRRLQVWTCKKKSCARKPGSIRAFREVKKGQASKVTKQQGTTSATPEPAMGLGSALFGGSGPSSSNNVNPFSTNAGPSAGTMNPFSSLASKSTLAAKPPQKPVPEQKPLTETFADKLKIGNSTPAPSGSESDPWPETKDLPQPYPFCYLDAFPEELEPTSEQQNGPGGESSKIKFDTDDSSSSAMDKDAFESSLDRTFQKFSDIVAQNPEQVLRYEFKGQPLLYSGADGVASRFVVPHGKAGAVKGIPRCDKCGSQRAFEMQLTPYLIYEIEKDEVMDMDSGMEWGAIIVGTCVNNCGEGGTISFREEWVGVQWEERVARR